MNTIKKAPLKLQPIRWGKRDDALAKAVCMNAASTTPPPEFDGYNPLVQRVVKDALRRHGFTS